MKKILIGLGFALFGLQSCDVLDVDPQSFYSENVAYASIENVDFYVKDLYQAFREYADIEKPVDVYDDGFSDLLKYSWAAIAPGNQVNKLFYYGQGINADRDFRNKWDQAYWHIRELNEFLVDMHNGLASGLDQEKLAVRIAEVRVIRAFVYQELVKRYGGVVLRISEEKVDDHTDRSKARSSEAECWDFIINELDKAAKVLPEQWKDKDGINHVGRVTKGAAYGLKARAALYAKRWQDAVDACDEVLKLEKKGVHALLGKNQYNYIFSIPNNKELLLSVNYEKMKLHHTFNLNCCPPYDYKEAGALKDFCGAAMTPTEEYASQFDIKLNGNWQSFSWDNLSQYANGPWADRDPRFYSSILYNGASWINDRKLQVYVGGHDGFFDFKNDPADDYKRSTATGYYIRKFVKNDAEINFVDVQSDQFWIEMRMAEIYLIRSEAKARLEKWGEAYIDLNKIRTRVGMPALPQQNVWDNYLVDLEKERICELGMEGHRFFDLVRWDKAVETLNGKRLHGVKITKLPTGVFEYKVVECDTEDRLFPKQYTISPIPTAELVANTLCEQSDLWK